MSSHSLDHDDRGPLGTPILRARSLVYSYGNSPALLGLTLDVGRGEILAIGGPSGSGKSTLLLCLAGIVRPDAGAVTYGEQTLGDLDERSRSRLRRTEFGVLFQFGQLVPELTAAENVALPLMLGGGGRKPSRTAALNWMERFDVAELADKRPPEMSGGQQQRVALSRAMVTEPSILFADEPTGALDRLSGETVLSQLTRVAREAQTTVILVTHDAKVAAYGDREVIVRDGVIESDAIALEASR